MDASVQRIVIPAADIYRASIVMARTNEVEHVIALIEHVGANLADVPPVQLRPFCRCLLTNSTTASHRTSMSVKMAEFRHSATRMSFAFHKVVAAIAPQDNVLVNRVPGLNSPSHCPRHGTSVQRIVITRCWHLDGQEAYENTIDNIYSKRNSKADRSCD